MSIQHPPIPKRIHYCWFGGGPLGEAEKNYMGSWRRHLPDFEIIRWDERNFDPGILPFSAEAHRLQKWAFVADVARVHALRTQGGLYLDTDMEILKPLDGFLRARGFLGFEKNGVLQTGLMAFELRHPLMEDMWHYYKHKSFHEKNGDLAMTPNTQILTRIAVAKYGLVKDGRRQTLQKGVEVWPEQWFCPLEYENREMRLTKNTHAIHHYAQSWTW